MPPTDRYVATAEFYVRYGETDAQGIVNHASYVVWMEEARSHYARSRNADYHIFEQAGYALSVIQLEARYMLPARYGDLVGAHCWVDDLKSRTITFGYEIINAREEKRLMTGMTRHICVNREGKVQTLPAEWKKHILG
jgi:acyl-CoA thioester hydrolase